MLLESDKVSSGMKTIGIKRKVDGEIRIYIYEETFLKIMILRKIGWLTSASSKY